MKLCTRLVAVSLFFLAVGLSTANAVDLYWDVNGTADGATVDGFGDGTWNGTNAFWNTDPTGGAAGTIQAWTDTAHAHFSAGTDTTNDPLGGAIITVTGTQTASAVTFEEGYYYVDSGVINTGAGNVTVQTGATVDIKDQARFNNAGKFVLDGGKLIYSYNADTTARSIISATKGIEIGASGIGYISVDNGSDAVEYTGVYSGVITGTDGTTTNGGFGTLVKTGKDILGVGATTVSGVSSQTLFTFARLVVEEGSYRGRHQTFDGTVKDTIFGAVPTSVLPDAITLNGGGIGSNGAITLHANRGITIGPNGGFFDSGGGASLVVPGPLSGSGTLTIGRGVGSTAGITFSNAGNVGTFSGNINMQGAIMILNSSLTTPNFSGFGRVQVVGAGSILTVGSDGASTTYSGTVESSGTFRKVGGGTLTLNSTTEWSNTGTLDIQGGSVRFDNPAFGFGNAQTITIASGATLDMNSIGDAFGGLNGAGNVINHNATVGNGINLAGAGTYTFSGIITGAVGESPTNGDGKVQHTGPGTQTFTGANTYTGGTTVTAGILRINNDPTLGSGTGSGAVSVTGGRLDGTGRIDGAITVGAGGTIAAGTGTGASVDLETTTLNLQTGANINFFIGNGTAPLMKVTTPNGLTLGTNSILNIIGAGATAGTYTVLDYDTSFNGTFDGSGTLTNVIVNNASGLELGPLGIYRDAGDTTLKVDLLAIVQERIWNFPGGGNWSVADTANWRDAADTPNAGQPNGPGSIARFTDANPGEVTIVNIADSNKTVGLIQFNEEFGGNFVITASGANRLVMDNTTGNATIQVDAGGDGGANMNTISAPVTLTDATNVNVASGVAFQMTGAVTNTGGLIKGGDGSFAATGVISGAGGVTNNGGTTTLSNTNTFTGRVIINGGTVVAAADLNLGAAPGSVVANRLTFDGGTLQTTGAFAAMHVNRGITVNAGGGTLDVESSAPTTYAGVMTGTGNMVKTGNQQLTLSGASTTYDGAWTISQGILESNNQTNALGSTVGNTTVASGATLQVRGAAAIAESLILNGTGVGNVGALHNVAGNKTMSGAISLATSGVRIGATAGTLTLTGGITGTNTNLTIGGDGRINQTTNPINIGSGTLTKEAPAGISTLQLSTTNTIGAFNFNSGRLVLGAAGAMGTGTVTVGTGTPAVLTIAASGSAGPIPQANNIALNTNATLHLSPDAGSPATVLEFTGVISGTTGAVVRGRDPTNAAVGVGTLKLSGANTFGGGFSHTSNALILNHKSAAGTGTYTIGDAAAPPAAAINVSASQDLSGANAIANALTINRDFTVSGSNNLEYAGATTLATTSPTITTTNSARTTLSGNITGTGFGITKAGAGVLELKGNNIYDGVTTINNGTLLANNASGSATGSGAVNVNSGGTLGGTGSVSGLVTVASGGRIAPGASIGTLTATGGATLEAGSLYSFELGSSLTADLLNVTLNDGLTINGAPAGITIADAGGMTAGIYKVIDYIGAVQGSGLAAFLATVPTGPAGFTYALSQTATQINVEVTAAPGGDFAGDYNDDGAVDAADYVMWRHASGNSGFGLQNDTATPGFQDPGDVNTWAANFGNVDGGGSDDVKGAVPEPSTIGLVLIGLAALAGRRRIR